MRYLGTAVLCGVLVLGVFFVMSSCTPSAEAKGEKERGKRAARQVLRHVVLFKFKQSATKEQIQQVVREFAALPRRIDAIIDFEMGTDVSIENKSKGFTHGFVVTFRDEKGRAAYLPHPAHKRFVKLVGPLLEDVLVFDYRTERP